jgi:uncharacterized protein
MKDRLLTPSKITAWLDCAHFLTLRHQVDDGLLVHEGPAFGSLARLLLEKGNQHESDCLAEYRRQGKSILEIPERDKHETFEAWVARVGDPFDDGYDAIFQMPMIHQSVRGIADFLVRVNEPLPGRCAYEPVDAKLARAQAKPGHVLQLCFYADALESMTGTYPEQLHLWLGSGQLEHLKAEDFKPYWNRLRSQLGTVLAGDAPATATVAEPCDHCSFCEFAALCDQEWRDKDSLIYLAGIRRQDRTALEAASVSTLAALSELEDPIEDLRPQRLQQLVGQAVLQATARTAPDEPPPHQLIAPSEDPTWGRGFTLMPEPDEGDVFLDFEGHPFWRADSGLFFLLGLIHKDNGAWRYKAFWAHDLEEEAAAAQGLIDYLVNRRMRYPGMHVYHYNHTERSALERLALDHGVGEVALAELVDTGLFIDLLLVARNAMQVGTESYGLKHLERLTGYERGHEIDKGAGAVLEYEEFMKTRDSEALDRIVAYNEDDVRATKALRDWLVDQRPSDLEWRTAILDPGDELPELDERVTELHAFGPGTPEHLLGDVLGYWRREWRAHVGPKLARSQGETEKLLEDPEALAGLEPVGLEPRFGKNDRAITPAMVFRLPGQAAEGFKTESSVIYATPEGPIGFASVNRIDLHNNELELSWNQRAQDLGTVPSVVMLNDWVHPRPKPAALSDLADRMIDPSTGSPNEVSTALLRRDLPAFEQGKGPADGEFSTDLEEMMNWILHLENSYVAIQGPPGTGKTFRGAHLVLSLIFAGKRVGITAMSHHAIDNLLEEIIKIFGEGGDLENLVAVRKGKKPSAGGLPGVSYTGSNSTAANPKYNLVAGTTWLFANDRMRSTPVDVLIIDEAGQLALADALAASVSARNLVLLGDPLQLPQVSQASHPGGGGLSVLEHVLGEDMTMPPDRGVFLDITRRMHPDVCTFISDQIYEGRLSTHPSCATQNTELGTGLRWIRAHHVQRSTESPEEADLVAEEIKRLIGTTWTNKDGTDAALGPRDIMVVAPYNDQVNLIRARLDQDVETRGVPVGTVDKFQGREAAVVFFTLTTSDAAEIVRGTDFLFSRNRLNVAVSRARCLAYLVCTEELLNSRARTVPEMRLISTLCSFVEHAT